MNPENAFQYCFAYEGEEPCTNRSIRKNGYCDDHQQYAGNLNLFTSQNNRYCSKLIKKQLDEVKEAKGKTTKAGICRKIFDFLLTRQKFLLDNIKFSDTVLNKLLELRSDKIDPMILYPEYYIVKMFPYYATSNEISFNPLFRPESVSSSQDGDESLGGDDYDSGEDFSEDEIVSITI